MLVPIDFFPIVHLIAWRTPVRTWSVYYFLILKEHIYFTWNGKFKLPINLIKTIYFILLWLLGCRKVHPRHFIHSSYLIKQCRYISVCKNSWDLWRALLHLASRWRSMVFDGGPLNRTFYPYPPCMTKWPWGTSTYFSFNWKLGRGSFQKLCNDLVLNALQSPPCWTFGIQRMLLWVDGLGSVRDRPLLSSSNF